MKAIMGASEPDLHYTRNYCIKTHTSYINTVSLLITYHTKNSSTSFSQHFLAYNLLYLMYYYITSTHHLYLTSHNNSDVPRGEGG